MAFLMLCYWYVGILLLVTISNALLVPSSYTINTVRRGGYHQHIIVSSSLHNKPQNNNVIALNAYDRFQKDDNTFGNRNRGGRDNDDIDEEAEQLARDLAARRGINVNNNERRGERERLQQQDDSMGRNNPNSSFGKDIGGGPPFASGPTNPSFGNNAARMSSGPIPVTQSFGRAPQSSRSDRYDELYEDIINSEQGPQDENLFRKRMNDIPPPSDTPRRLSEQQWLRKENREIPPDAVVRGQKQQQRNFVHNDQQRRVQPTSRTGLDIDRNNPPLSPRGAPPRNIPPVRRSDSANYMNDQRSGMSANYQQPQSYRQPPPPSQTYNSINRERRERLSRQPMPPNQGPLPPPPNVRNAYKNMAMPPPPMSPPLSEIASWNYRSQQANQNNVYNNMPTSSWNSMGGRQWRVPTKGQGPGGYQQGIMPPYQQGPPMPPPYQQGRSMGYNNRRSASVPLSQLAIQPHIEPIDRDTKSSQQSQTPYGSGTRTSSSMESKPLPFANMDSSEFRQPYSSNRREGKEPNGVGSQPMSREQSFDNNFPGQQPPMMMMQPPSMMQQPMMQQPPPMQQPPSMQQQQQQQQQQQPGGRKSFQPPNFRDVPQSDFRQPSQFEEQQTFGGQPAPSFPGSPSSQGGGPPPNFDQQQSPPFDDDMMFGPPFGVPPMMFPPMGIGGPPPPGNGNEKRPSVFSGEDGVKVPKDPILEKQKRQQQQKSVGSVPQTNQPLKGKEEIKIPKDPFMERKKKTKTPQKQQQVAQKQPTDPFVERQKQQERLLEMGLPPPQPIPIQQQNNPLKGEERIPKESRERRPNEPQQRRPNEPQIGSRNSYARKSSIPESDVNTPRDTRQPPTGKGDTSFGSRPSFGSDGGDDMTYEEYLQYYNLNK